MIALDHTTRAREDIRKHLESEYENQRQKCHKQNVPFPLPAGSYGHGRTLCIAIMHCLHPGYTSVVAPQKGDASEKQFIEAAASGDRETVEKLLKEGKVKLRCTSEVRPRCLSLDSVLQLGGFILPREKFSTRLC